MNPNHKIIAITGGIGAGKSVISRILEAAGYSVYDCDSRAKQLMNTSSSIKHALTSKFGSGIYSNGTLDRQLLSDIIFNDNKALAFVNSVVHPAVRDDIKQWAQQQEHSLVFIETAILNEGGLDTMINEVWNVVAPVETRISRVMKRNSISREKVMERIAQQQDRPQGDNLIIIDIINDNTTPLLPQLINALEQSKT